MPRGKKRLRTTVVEHLYFNWKLKSHLPTKYIHKFFNWNSNLKLVSWLNSIQFAVLHLNVSFCCCHCCSCCYCCCCIWTFFERNTWQQLMLLKRRYWSCSDSNPDDPNRDIIIYQFYLTEINFIKDLIFVVEIILFCQIMRTLNTMAFASFVLLLHQGLGCHLII